ncbi:head-to-tail adaptor [Microbacterium phage Fizzles]|nr:head-to-tail adaptor [Microbacterium phage Fizzles]
MICYPSDTDWGCAYTPEQLAEMRNDPVKLKLMELSEARAWYTLASLTAWQLGVCPDVIRPIAARCAPRGSWMSAVVDGGHTSALPNRTIGGIYTPYVTGGVWVNGCGCGPSACGCSDSRVIELPGPVGAIERIDIAGEVIAASRYRVDNGNLLVAVDPELVWPLTQDQDAAPGAPDTFTITYYRGMAPNELVRSAAGALAAEFYKACRADKNCRFPRKVKEVTRNGVTYEVDTAMFTNGVTNVPEADFVINMLNPSHLKYRPRAISPDMNRRPRRPTFGAF